PDAERPTVLDQSRHAQRLTAHGRSWVALLVEPVLDVDHVRHAPPPTTTLAIIVTPKALHGSMAIDPATAPLHALDGHRSVGFVRHQQARSVTAVLRDP